MWVQSERRRKAQGVSGRKWAANGWLCLLIALGVGFAGFAGSASAMRIDFPDDPVLSDPATAQRLTLGSGYTFQITGSSVDPGWTNSAGDTITVNAQVSFAGADSVLAEFMVVFTSIRVGLVSSITCPELSPGGALPIGRFDYVDNSFGGAVGRQLAPTDSEISGESQVCNAEDVGSPFFGLVFAPNDSGALQFSFQIATTEDDLPDEDFLQLRLLKQGYSAIPEPASALLVSAGLVGLALRRRGSRSTP